MNTKMENVKNQQKQNYKILQKLLILQNQSQSIIKIN